MNLVPSRRGTFLLLMLLALVPAAAAHLVACAHTPTCPAADREWLFAQTFAQVDRIDEGWAVLVDEEVDEHPLPLHCLPRGISEGAIFRRGRRDRDTEGRIYAQVCSRLATLPTVPPARAEPIRCRAPP